MRIHPSQFFFLKNNAQQERTKGAARLPRLPLLGFVFLFFISSGALLAQVPDSLNEQELPPVIPVDTVPPSAFHPASPGQLYALNDTTLQHFRQFDPIRLPRFDYAHLGTIGSAHWPLIYRPEYRKGFALGWDQFSLYQIHPDSIRFFQLNNAYSEIYYTQGGEQEDARIDALFSRNFGPNTNFSLEYRRLLYIPLAANKYRNQRARNTAFAAGFWYEHPEGRYKAGLSFSRNSTEQKDNGGITTDSLFGRDDFQSPLTVPVYLEEAQTRYVRNDFSFHQFLDFSLGADSTGNGGSLIRFHHHLQYGTGLYKYFDELGGTPDNPLSQNDSIFYGDLLVDVRGLRQQLNWQRLENRLTAGWELKRRGPPSANPPARLQLGASHRYFWLQTEPEMIRLQNLLVEARLDVSLGDLISLRTYGHLGLLENQGDYKLEGELKVELPALGILEGRLTNELYSPNFVQQQLRVNEQTVWENAFNKTLATRLYARWTKPEWKLSVSAHYHLIDEYIYFNQEGFPQQESDLLNIFQLSLSKSFRLGPIGNENVVTFQQSTLPEIIAFPEIYSTNSLFIEGFLFRRAMLARFGLDLRLSTAFFPYRYQPLSGQFFIQNEFETGFYPIADLFLAFKVSDFRFFFRFDNLTSLLSEERFYQTADHPYLDTYFRFGFRWILRN
jgi:hypothetical protein